MGHLWAIGPKSGIPDFGSPDELGGVYILLLKLRQSLTTSAWSCHLTRPREQKKCTHHYRALTLICSLSSRVQLLFWCPGVSGCRCCLGGAQNLQIECVRMLYASGKCLHVVKRDPSLKTRIRASPNSSGVLRYESETALVLFQEPRFKSFL